MLLWWWWGGIRQRGRRGGLVPAVEVLVWVLQAGTVGTPPGAVCIVEEVFDQRVEVGVVDIVDVEGGPEEVGVVGKGASVGTADIVEEKEALAG